MRKTLIKRFKELSNKTRSCPRKSPFRARTLLIKRSNRGESRTTKWASSKIPTAPMRPKMLELQPLNLSRGLDLNLQGPGSSVELGNLQTLMGSSTCERSVQMERRSRNNNRSPSHNLLVSIMLSDHNRHLSHNLHASRILTDRKSPLRLRFSLRRSKGALRSPRCAKSSRKSGTILHNLRLP